MIARYVATAAMALLLAAQTATASAQAVTDIALGETKVGKPGARTDIYRFVGTSGMKVDANLVASGKSAIILYTPQGDEMLSTRGAGSVSLSAYLPLDDVFFIAVVTHGSAKPYALKLNGKAGDLHLEIMAYELGYAVEEQSGNGKPIVSSSCWVEPGLKIRRTWPHSTEEHTLGRGGKRFATWKLKNGTTGAAEEDVTLNGDTLTFHRVDGARSDRTMRLAEVFARYPLQDYTGYLCAN